MASITAKISTKYDSKGISDAQKALQGLGKVASGVSTVFKGFVVIKAFDALKSLASGSIQAFSESQTSSTALLQSVSNNVKLTSGAFDRLNASANAFQKTTLFDADDLNKNQRFLSDMKLSEEQIDSTMKAAMDMAASGVMPLDQAVQTLGKTYTGSAGQLGKMNGQIKELTKEQLKNGEAVKIIAEQYKGYASAMTNTFSGKDLQFGNMLGDLQESIGAIGGSFKFLAQDFAMPWIEKLTTFFTDNRDKIINFVINLPEIAGLAFRTIGAMLPKLFTLDFWIGYLKIIGQFFITSFKNIFISIYNLIVAIGTTLWEPLKYGFELIGWSIKSIFFNIINGLNGLVENFVNGFINSINKITSIIPNLLKIETISFLKLEAPDKPQNNVGGNISDAWKNVGTGIVDGLIDTKNAYVDGMKDMGSLLSDTFSTDIGSLKDSIGKVLGKELPDNLKKALNPKATTTTASTGETENTGLMSALGGMKGLLSMFGQLGQAINLLITGNPLGIIVQIITSFMGMFSGIENAGKVMNLFTTIFERTGEIIGPIVNDALAPLVDILGLIGQIVGVVLAPVFDLLGTILLPICNVISVILQVVSPLLGLFSTLSMLFIKMNPILGIVLGAFNLLANGLTFIFNKILTPVVNWIIKLVTGMGNMIINMYNGVVNALNGIDIFGWHPFSMGTMNTLSYADLSMKEINNDGSGVTAGGTSSSSSSASYTAAKDTIVNFNFNNSFVNGDADKIVLYLDKRLKELKAQGLA